MRYTILLAMFVMGTTGMTAEEQRRPIVGAIRWDAWSGCEVTRQVEKTLGPKKYHHRLPWFAKVSDDKVAIDGSPQDVMDREIDFASGAGMDYWAFLLYNDSYGMSTGLKQYLKSRKRNRIKFCIILHNSLGAKPEDRPRERDRAVQLLGEQGYQKVLGNRPLVYLFGASIDSGRFEEWLKAARQKGHNPYCVFMGSNPPGDYKKAKAKGFDAVSAYACSGAHPTFAGHVKNVETHYWRRAAKAKVPYIPLVSTGWNKEPRKDNPVSWEVGHRYHKQKVFTPAGKPEEIATHLKNAFEFIGKNPDICKANAVICYAWNEYDEGGWLAPTRGSNGKPDDSRLKAIGNVIKNWRTDR